MKKIGARLAQAWRTLNELWRTNLGVIDTVQYGLVFLIVLLLLLLRYMK
jgi:hypothetical protein